jgi:Short C-terminal domain
MGLLRMATRTAVVAGTATAVSGRVARRQAARYDQPTQAPPEPSEAPPPPPPESAPPPAPEDETVTKLQNLAQLHSQGVLSDEEFAAAKAKALGI